MPGSGGVKRSAGRRRPFRVVVCTRIYAPEPSAASLRLQALVRELSTRADVRVLTTRPPDESYEADDANADVRRWPVLRDAAGYVRGYLPYLSFDVPLFLRILFGRRADVYVCEPPPTTGVAVRVATALLRRPYVYYAADIWSDASMSTNAPSAVVRVVAGIERAALRGASEILVVTEGVRDRVADLVPRTVSHVVGHGVDFTKFSADGPHVEHPADIVYVGSASEWHGAEVALDAVIEVLRSNAGLTAAFVGQGSSWNRMRHEAAGSDVADRIAFFDSVPPEAAARWLRGAKVSVATLAPGQGYDFAVPTKLYASVAVGTPVVYAGPEPVRSLIDEQELGVGCDYDRAALVEALGAVIDGKAVFARADLIAWAAHNVSSAAVARRAADVVISAASEVTGVDAPRR